MNPIPKKLKEDLANDPNYKRCALTGFTRFKIDWHHAIIIAGKQVNEKCFIIPLWDKKHSAGGHPDSVHNCKITKEWVELIALKRANPEIFEKYKKANLKQRLKYLIKKYEK